MGSSGERFMSIAGLAEHQGKSFEEVRVDDYIKAYTSTGRPPQPCPQEPGSDIERTTLNLPTLFKPYPVSSSLSSPSGSSPIPPKPSIVDPANLPVGQEYRASKLGDEQYQNIGCMTEFAYFSHEELRYYAYRRGNSLPPPTVKIDSFVKSVGNPVAAFQPSSSLDSPENMHCITAQPSFSDHSFEELRVAFLVSGRQLSSAEIREQRRLPTPATSSPSTAPGPPAAPFVSPPASLPPPPLLGSSLRGSPFSLQQKPVSSFTFKF